MIRARSNREGRFRVIPLAVALFQLATWIWVPVIHASTDVPFTTAGVEQHHSSDCSKIHVETWCHTCGATFDLPDDGDAYTAFDELNIQHTRCHAGQHKVGSAVIPKGNPVRAPPATQR